VQQSSVVLVVEDELAIQGFVENVLSEAGFDAVSLSSGEQALTLLIGEKKKFGALVADVKLNGTLDGWAVAKRAREIRPDLPVVYMTGAAPDEWASRSDAGQYLVAEALCAARTRERPFSSPKPPSTSSPRADSPLVSRFRRSYHVAARRLRASESKGHSSVPTSVLHFDA
jgi:CheY-like chemotaxis protein